MLRTMDTLSEDQATNERTSLVFRSTNDRTRPEDNQTPDSTVAGAPFKWTKIAVYCVVLNFLLEIFDMILITPQVALFQRALCLTYYSKHDSGAIGLNGSISEELCRISPIQHELAILRGWKGFFDSIPGSESYNLRSCIVRANLR